MNTDAPAASTTPAPPRSRRTLAACCGAHLLHDGFSDLLYVLFPVWQAAFGLSFAQVGLLKSVYSGSMAALQLPASLLAERIGERVVLVFGTLVAAIGFVVSGWTAG
jgi:FSR family fosmidomycin resistance protein-like MFS transporter